MKNIFTCLVLIASLKAYASDFKCPDGKTYPVSLTFDDGPAGAKTNKALDILKKKNVKGTFFVLGENFEGESERKNNFAILDRMKAEGHVIGSHTFNHIAHSTVSSEKAFENIDKATEVLKDYLDPVLRLPYGDGSFPTKDPVKKAKNEKIMNHIKEQGFAHVGWSIDTNDWDPKKRPYVLQSMMSQICSQRGGVILFHDIHQNTVDHLEEWIDAIIAAGHRIEPLSYFYKNLEVKKEKTPEKKEEDRAFCILNDYKNSTVDSLAKKVREICSKIK